MRRLLAVAAGAVLLAAWLARPTGVTAPGAAPAPPPAGPPAEATHAPGPAPALLRDPFRYADAEPRAPAAETRPEAPAAPETRPPAAQPTPEPIRLIGFVRRGAELNAVIAVAGASFVVAAGDVVEGHQVLSVGEDVGIRLRAPSGEELRLAPTR